MFQFFCDKREVCDSCEYRADSPTLIVYKYKFESIIREYGTCRQKWVRQYIFINFTVFILFITRKSFLPITDRRSNNISVMNRVSIYNLPTGKKNFRLYCHCEDIIKTVNFCFVLFCLPSHVENFSRYSWIQTWTEKLFNRCTETCLIGESWEQK